MMMMWKLFRRKDCRFSWSWKFSSSEPRENQFSAPGFGFIISTLTPSWKSSPSLFCALDLTKLKMHYLLWSLLQWLQGLREERAENRQRDASVGLPRWINSPVSQQWDLGAWRSDLGKCRMQGLLHSPEGRWKSQEQTTKQPGNFWTLKAMIGLKLFPSCPNKNPVGPGDFMKSQRRLAGRPCGSRKGMGPWLHQIG